MWVFMCLFKLELSENAEPHSLHEYGFSPVCLRIWNFKLELSKKQENVFSPVCIHMCLFIWELYENADPQTSQE